MRMPNGDRAIVPDDKLTGFLLNEEHPEQPGHAVLFRQLLGIVRENPEPLREALVHAAAQHPASPGQPSPYGSKYEVRFDMTGIRGTYTILSVWMIEHGSEVPRLVTAYIE